jgi:hypothetical protein
LRRYGGLFNKGKVVMITEFIIRQGLNLKFRRFGKMLKLEIDSKLKTISLEILPKGEDKPIQVRIGNYELVTGDQGGLKFSNIATSREWITESIKKWWPERTIRFDNAEYLKFLGL